MSWVLVVLIITVDGLSVEIADEYPTMLECFYEREKVVEELGRPIVNYQAVCIQREQFHKL
jgi:hypothetical protein